MSCLIINLIKIKEKKDDEREDYHVSAAGCYFNYLAEQVRHIKT